MSSPQKFPSYFGALLLLGLVIFNFQNCSLFDSPVNFKESHEIIQSRGNGDGLDGKPEPGEYVRTLADFSCEQVRGEQALINVDVQTGLLVKDNCQNVNFQFSLNDPGLSFEFYNPTYFTFAGGIFEKIDPKIVLQPTQAFCRFKDSTKGVDAIIKSDSEGSLLSARIIMGEYSSQIIRYIDYPAMNKSVSGTSTDFQSNDDSLVIKINGAPAEYKNLSGQIVSVIDGEPRQYSVICQKMSEEPLLKMDPSGLVAYYKFDVDTIIDGNVIIDSKGNNAGTVAAGTGDTANKSLAGIVGRAMSFDGVDDLVNMGNVLDMTTNDFSLSFWMSAPDTTIARTLLGKRWDLGGGTPGWNIVFSPSFRITGRLSDGTTTSQGGAGIVLPNAQFHHVVIVHDRLGTGETIYYLDGTEVSRFDISSLGNISYAGSFLLGSANAPGSTFQGSLDEVSIWRRALSATDVQALFTNLGIY